ncbi:MAG: hypothetical protein KU28_01765 [Sulfurovum sp. PC08-66]|nr:MAG: hypothetical protein KU28_01765 [Sulfurovum sp. PC08-66]KIM12661.1 MAG: hypothetical protein KU37_01870 [Sulfuricurvum sp. PC08-66]
MVQAPLSIEFSLDATQDEAMEREFQMLSGVDDDAIGQWLKLAKAKGDTQDTDRVLLQLIIELHRKIDRLEQKIDHATPNRIELSTHAMIDSIGFEDFVLTKALLEPAQNYYGRVTMPVYPQRDVAIFFTAIDAQHAHITRMHERDENDWNSYVTARERIMIRQLKGR